jgi:hypothetical protein
MRERRGPFGRTVGAVADSLASAARRGGPRAGAPRVVVYDAAGHATLLRQAQPEHERMIGIAERMIELWHVPASRGEADAG